MKRIELSEGNYALGLQVYLPLMNLYLIVTQKAILCDESFHMQYLADRYPDIILMQVQIAHRLEDLLEHEIVGVSHAAKQYGVKCWMKGKDGLEKIP